MFKTYAVYNMDTPVEVLDFDINFATQKLHKQLNISYLVHIFDEDGDEVELWVDSSEISELCLCMP